MPKDDTISDFVPATETPVETGTETTDADTTTGGDAGDGDGE